MHATRLEPCSANRRRRGAVDLLALFESALKLAGCFLIATLIGLSVVFAFTRLDPPHAPAARAPSVRSASLRARAEQEILVLDRAMRVWAEAHGGKYPSALVELLQPGTPLELPRSILTDPWKRAYRYQPSADPEEAPKIVSFGRDGHAGGNDENADVDNTALDEFDSATGLDEALSALKDLQQSWRIHAGENAGKSSVPEPPEAPREPNQRP